MITVRMSVIGDGHSSFSALTFLVNLLVVAIAGLPAGVSSQQDTANSGQSSNSMSSGAMIGIIIAGICLLLIVIGSIILFLICRKLNFQNKPTDSAERERRDQLDLRSVQETGCGLPVDIPVEALAREPPPRYASIENLNADSSSVSGHRRAADVAVVGEQPPPYCEVSRSGVRALDQRADFRSAPFLGGIGRSFDSPPLYQSRVELDASRLSMPEHSTTNAYGPARALPSPLPLQAGSVPANPSRLHSVDSFRDIPSMSDVLLTSSRTSLPTSPSAAVEMDASVTPVNATVAVQDGRSRRTTHSATPSTRHEATISGRSADAVVTTEYSRSTAELSTSVAAAPPRSGSANRRQEHRDGSSRHDRRARQMQERQRIPSSSGNGAVAETSVSVRSTARKRTTSDIDTIVDSICELQPPSRGRRATGSDQTSVRLPPDSYRESVLGGMAISEAQSDGSHNHRRRNNTNQRHEGQATARTTSHSLPRLSLVDEEQRQSPQTTTSSTTRLELVGHGSVV